MSATTSEGAPGDLLTGTLHGRPRTILRAVVLAVLRPLIALRLVGVENVPCDGPLLVASNHLSNADPIILEAAFPRPLFFLGKSELFRNPIFRWILHRFGGIPVERGTPDRAAIRRARAVLEQGIALGDLSRGRSIKDRRAGQRTCPARVSSRCNRMHPCFPWRSTELSSFRSTARYHRAARRAYRAALLCTSGPQFAFPSASTESESRRRRRRT